MSSDTIVRWSGVSMALGGLLWLFPWTGWFVEVGDKTTFAMTLAGLLLVAVGIIGLERRLANSGATNRAAYVLSLLGAGLVMASAAGGLVTGSSRSGGEDLGFLAIPLFAGMLGLILGIGGLGLTTLRMKALDRYSFAPLLLAVAQLAYVVSIGLNVGSDSLGTIMDISIAAACLCWLILGYAMTVAQATAVDQPAAA